MMSTIISSKGRNFFKRFLMFLSTLKLHLKIFERRLWDVIFLVSLILWLFGNRRYELYLAYVGKKPVGFCLMRKRRIWQIGVLEDYRGLGLGKALVPNYAKIVRTPKFRQNAVKFYESIGFKKTRETDKSIWLER